MFLAKPLKLVVTGQFLFISVEGLQENVLFISCHRPVIYPGLREDGVIRDIRPEQESVPNHHLRAYQKGIAGKGRVAAVG